MKLIKHQMEHCRVCLETIADEFEKEVAEQDADPFYKWDQIRNHTRYANDGYLFKAATDETGKDADGGVKIINPMQGL